MENLINLEKKINSELTTKINSSIVKHNQIYLSIDSNDIIDVILFMKTNEIYDKKPIKIRGKFKLAENTIYQRKK